MCLTETIVKLSLGRLLHQKFLSQKIKTTVLVHVISDWAKIEFYYFTKFDQN